MGMDDHHNHQRNNPVRSRRSSNRRSRSFWRTTRPASVRWSSDTDKFSVDEVGQRPVRRKKVRPNPPNISKVKQEPLNIFSKQEHKGVFVGHDDEDSDGEEVVGGAAAALFSDSEDELPEEFLQFLNDGGEKRLLEFMMCPPLLDEVGDLLLKR